MAITVMVTFLKTPNDSRVWHFSVDGIATDVLKVDTEQEINWQISNASVTGTVFHSDGDHQGVKFTPTITRPAVWASPNQQPTLNGGQAHVTDHGPFNGTTYAYRVFVQTPSTTVYSHDPEVTNTPP